ncbi:hypothetical protein ACPOL_3228 [Acidisarcina polymorpha]|uniref:Uncharacterized protein n=1 Tax=Acidisarcina polymorpha TaxID=2211140 RepID=A0A2Z5G026_9BACT|nr:hypothetical protein ACPOL_3228 [Acidisarcina polymorpha]
MDKRWLLRSGETDCFHLAAWGSETPDWGNLPGSDNVYLEGYERIAEI